MASDIATLVFSLLGVIFLLYLLIFKLLSWREDNAVLTLPLYGNDDAVFQHIDNIRMFTELCGIHKRCKIVVINYGASDWYCEKIKFNFPGYGVLEVVNAESAADEMNGTVFKEELNE